MNVNKFQAFYLFSNSLISTFFWRSWSWFIVFKPSLLGSNPSILNSATCKLASLRALFQRTYVCFIILFYLFLITISAELMVLPINPRSKKSHILSIVSGNLQINGNRIQVWFDWSFYVKFILFFLFSNSLYQQSYEFY